MIVSDERSIHRSRYRRVPGARRGSSDLPRALLWRGGVERPRSRRTLERVGPSIRRLRADYQGFRWVQVGGVHRLKGPNKGRMRSTLRVQGRRLMRKEVFPTIGMHLSLVEGGSGGAALVGRERHSLQAFRRQRRRRRGRGGLVVRTGSGCGSRGIICETPPGGLQRK